MLGLMQNQPLLISNLIEFADRHHGDGEIVSRRVEGDIHRSHWREIARRSRQVANALDSLKRGDGDGEALLTANAPIAKTLLTCREEGDSEEFVKLLTKREPLCAVFSDSGFANDSVKINVEQIFKLMSPDTQVKCI
jgi:hypothetical protein